MKLRNEYYVVFASIFNVLFLGTFILLSTRLLTPEQFGYFSFLLSLVSILAKSNEVIAQPTLFRRVSETSSSDSIIYTGIISRVIIGLLILVVGFLYLLIEGYSTIYILLFSLPLISYRLDGIRSIIEIPFKVSKQYKYVFSSQLIDNILLSLILLFLVVNQVSDVEVYTSAYVLSGLPGLLLIFWFFHKKVEYRPLFIKEDIINVIKAGKYIFGFSFIMILLGNLEILLLKYFDDHVALGLFAVSMRITTPLIIIPGIITTALFTNIVRQKDELKLMELHKIIIPVLTLVPMILAILWLSGSHFFTGLLFGMDYISAEYLPVFLFIFMVYSFILFYQVDYLISRANERKVFLVGFIYLFISLIVGIEAWLQFGIWGLVGSKIISSLIVVSFTGYFIPFFSNWIRSHLSVILPLGIFFFFIVILKFFSINEFIIMSIASVGVTLIAYYIYFVKFKDKLRMFFPK